MEPPGAQTPVPGLPQTPPADSPGALPDPAWARSPRRRLATQLREAGRAEPREVEALLAELLAVCRAVLRGGGRRAWLRLLEALRLCAPFRGLLSGRAPLPAYLRALRYQAGGSRALLADLDLLGALRRAFPREGAAPRDGSEPPWPLALAAEARRLPAAPEPVFAGLPCPFRAAWDALAAGLLAPRPVSLPELQRCVGPVGGRLARREAPWEDGLGMLPLALVAALPVDFASALRPSLESAAVACLGPPPARSPAADRQPPMSGLQAAQVLSGRYHAGEIRFFYLNTAPNRHFRPYDLVTVPGYLLKPQHYVFSPFGVLCVHPEEGSEALSLGDWHREARLWQLMQFIPFFRLFLVRKAFTRWYFNVKHLQYLKCREKLSLQLLQAVPHFGAALLHISRLLQELQAVHWLPTDTSRCYNFVELKRALAHMKSNADGLLHRFLCLCTSILELVRDDTYKMVHGLQMEVQGYKLYITKESPYQQRVEFERLQCRLREAESWLRDLGALALLVNFLVCQTLISVMHQEVSTFVNCTMQADGSTRKAVLRVQLVFSAENKLVLFPSDGELEDCLLGALQNIVETVLETTRVKSEKAEAQAGPRARTPEAEQPPCQAAGDLAGPASRGDQISRLREQLQQVSVTELCSAEAHLVHRLDLKACSGLQVVGHRLRAEYPLLSREQLERDLHSDSIIQKATAKLRGLFLAGLAETQLLCREYAWLGQIYQYVHSWSESQLESMKGWPAEEFVNQVLKLRTWVGQVQKVPHVVITFNHFFLVDCDGILQEILPLLASIDKDILALLLRETTHRSEQFIAELSLVLQLYVNVGTDIFTIAKCSQKLEYYQGQMTELQEYVDYVRALNEVIQQCYRPLSPSEESLENMLLDTWDAFVYQQREVSDFIVSRRLSIIAELSSSLQEATQELQELLTMVTVGRFQDPAQNPRVMEDELIRLLQRFQAVVGRVTDLCNSQRILTGGRTDLSLLTRQQEVIEIHIRVWQLFRIVSEQVKEWKCLAFIKFSAPLALERTEEWQKEGASLQRSLPSHHRIMQACLSAIANFRKYLPLLLKLGSHFLKLSCWKEIFAVMGVKCPMNMQFTLGQLLSYPLLEYSDAIFRVYAHEKSRHYARDTLQRVERAWAEKQFRLINFILNVPYQEPQPERFRRPTSGRQRAAKLEYISKDSGTYVLSDTTELKAAVEHSILTLQNMILSPFSSDILEEAKSWVSTLRTFESLLYAWVSFQQKWVFLNIVLYEMNITLPSAELDSRFQRLDAHFREVMRLTCNDPLVLSSIQLGPGSSRDSRFIGATLQAAFLEGSADLQGLIRALDYVLEATRMGFPRLFFLSNEELVAMLSTANETADAPAWSQRCFPGVCQLDLLLPATSQNLDAISAELPLVQVVGLLGSHGEKLKLCSAVPLGRKVTQWLCVLELRMKESVFNQVQECVAQRLALRPQLDLAFERRPGPTELPLHLVAECWAGLGNTFPAQCVLLAEEALWRVAVEEAFLHQRLRKGLELRLSLKLEAVVHYIRNYRSLHAWNPEQDHLGMLLGALIVVTIQQRDLTSRLLKREEASVHDFEWARHLKYSVRLLPEKARAAGLPLSCSWVSSLPGCWAEVLDSRFPYDSEFLGTGSPLLGSPSLDRTFLGLLLALEEFGCGGLLGHPDVGKSHTVRGLAQFLGRHLVTLHCTRQMSIGCLSRHLCGAVHSGALLLLESVETLEPAVLSAFSHRLVDLQRMCLNFQEGGKVAPSGQPSGVFPPASPGSESSGSSEEGEAQPGGLPELGTDDAEPYQPRVLGNILFGGRLLRVRETYGCVVTMESLPEQMRLALRPLAVLPPDLTRLAEVMLLMAGFREATLLAEKLCTFLKLERMLNPRPHFSSPTLIRKVIGAAINILFAPTLPQDPSPSRAKPSPRTTFFLGLEEEPAVVKALCRSPLLTGPEGPRLQNVCELLHDVFPSASLPHSEQLPPRLQSALVAQLQEDKLQPDPDLLLVAGQLSQAMQVATGILLLGPSGSGKTTAWRILSKAQSRLAASDATPGVQGSSAHEKAAFRPVNTACLWPNALSISEFVGSLEGSLWQDGVFSRILQRAATSAAASGTGEGSSQQWLVLDGVACQEWLEPISLLFSTRPFLSLPNGQRLRAPKNLRFLFEMLDASEMPPSVCTHCALLHLEGSQLWQVLLASAFAPAHHKYSLSLETLAALHSLAKELFPATMAFLQEHCCPALLPHAHPQRLLAQGVQETTAFTRIFQALLKHYMHRDQLKPRAAAAKVATESNSWTPPSLKAHSLDEVPTHHPLLAQSIFVFAYIWGFGSHLQTRCWPLFDHFVRRALQNSSLSIQLPAAVSTFDLYPLAEDGTLRPFNGRYLHSYLKALPMGFSVLPQHERVLFVLNMLLGTEQPILLVGEPGSGKSTFAEMLLQPNYLYHRVCLTPAFRTVHLRQLLLRRSQSALREKGLFPTGKPPRGAASKGRFLFLMEDLHLAFVDPVRGTSPVIESLRQTLTLQQFYHAETLELQQCPATGFNCFGTFSVPITGSLALCPRFGRLFSTVVLPAVSRESLLSMHTSTVLTWLEKFPLLTRHHELASAVVKATLDTYETVRRRFHPSPACCLFQFSLHDVAKVIKGMLLLRPRPGIHLSTPLEDHGSKGSSPRRISVMGRPAVGTGYTAVLSTRLIIRLWVHESLRTFCDPLRGKQQRELCEQILLEIATTIFCAKPGVLRVVPSLSSPVHRGTAVQFPSTSDTCLATASVGEEDSRQEHLLLTLQAEPEFPYSAEVGYPNCWDPVEQAPALALDPPDAPPWEDVALGEPENKAPETEPEEMDGEKRQSSGKPSQLKAPESHATPHRSFLMRTKHRTSGRKDSSGPLLPLHLLLLQGESPADIVFSKDLGPDFYGPNAHNPYQEKLWKTLEKQLSSCLPPDFLLCSDGLRHVVRLARLLWGPDRHGALVSFVRCTGRQSLVALVARATDTLLMSLLANTSEAEALALLRSASWQAGITGRRVLLLVHPGVSVAILHQVLALMIEGTCPGLSNPDDSMAIIQAMLQENQSIKRNMREDLVLQKFLQLVRSNLHVFLLLGTPGSLALPPLTATVLAQSLCSLEIYQNWSQESLLQVASKRLKGHFKSAVRLTREPPSLHAQKDLLHNTALAASRIHFSAANYASSLADSLPLVSPKSFLDFLDSYVCLLDSLQEQVNRRAERMKLALQKMDEVSKKQQEHTRDVRFLQQKLVKIKQQMAQSQKEVEREQEVLRQQEVECRKYEARINVLTKKRDTLEKKKEMAMKKVTQDYKAALAALRVQDIEELRSYRQPPALVVQVTDPLCLMFQVEPGWESAKLLLSREDFYQDLIFYPKETLSMELFQALGQVVCHKGLSMAAIQNASQAAATLYQWICSIYWYQWALREWQPAMLQLQSCEEQINAEKVSLGDRRLHSEFLRDTTQTRIRELRQKQEHQEKLLQQLTQSLQAKEEASTVESSVAEHLASWTAVAKDLECQQSTVHGDALLCSAVISYLGPFCPLRRKELLEKWQAVCEGSQVLLSPCDVSWLLQKELPCPGQAPSGPPLLPRQNPLKVAAVLSSAQQQRLWDRLHKPKDAESRLAAMIVHSWVHLRAHRWPLLVDPDKQAQTWLLMTSSLEEEESQAQALCDLVPDLVEQGVSEEIPEDNLEILSLTSPDLEQSLKDAVRFGNPVLLTDFEKDVPWCSALQQLMEKESFWSCPEGKIFFPGSEEDGAEAEHLPIPPSFCLYLCTELPLKSLAAEADHSLLKRLNLIDLSLSQEALEEQLLSEVLHVERPEILKNQQVLYLGILQLEGKLEATEEELMDLISQPQRSLLEEENFMPIVRLLQTQIQALHATHRHMVSQHQDQATLCGRYRPVACLAVGLHEVLQQVGRLHPLYRFPTEFCIGRVRQALISAKRQEANKQESLEARLLELSRMVLWQLLTQALPCLREVHRPLYFFLGAVTMLRVAGDVSPLEWLAFTQGLQDPAAKALLLPLGPGLVCPSWVSAEAWEECALLENLPGFHGLLASLAEKAVQWQEYFSLPSTVVGPALCPSHAHLSPFQRAILWRILCPSAMCQGRVVVISFGTPDASRRVQRTLPFCTRKGKWLVLDNCQLLSRWDPEILQQLDLVLTTPPGLSKGGPLEIHPKFRLWLITTLNAPDSVPGPVHRSAITLFCEMPLELKGILAHTHQWLQGQVQNLDTEKRLSLLVLHGVLLYRQNYARWTQAASYLWSHGEVLAGLKALEKLSRMAGSSEEAQLQLAGTILYGGHVLDEGDAQAVESLCRQCLAPASHPLPGSGLQRLLAAVIGHTSPGLFEDEASAATQGRMQQLSSPTDPAWVGLCDSLQPQMLASRSQDLLSALKASQGLWPRRIPRLPTTLEQLAKRGLEVVQELQEQLAQCGWEVGARGRPPHGQPRPKPRPLQRFLLEEAGSFLALLEQVGRDLACAQECLQGMPCSSPRCTALLQALQRQQLPRHWLPYVPTGPEPLHDWLGTLQRRSELLCHYLQSIGGEPVVCYQLAAFQQPQRLFLALLQEKAQPEKQELESFHLDQQVLPNLLPPDSAPEKGIYLGGLEVYHAAWNTHGGHLQESFSAQACQLPPVWVQASREPWTAASVPHKYQCPVYLGTPQAALDLCSQRVIMSLALPSKMSPEQCTQQRVHAISVLR
ncbi:dynein heavy chain domain-containing protein 1 isoform X2 [Crotalus tigris]|uniref:dynein heavy chain domain-containing protein 1 isoform X2 n=1 Tax=Crotalus tigris TaxID=88082 RepID=UPI00192F8A0E|nr:dynein heavy chain domain-containing protein 1 isoform X2 [Crotalus tigris]